MLGRFFNGDISEIQTDLLARALAEESGKSISEVKEALKFCKEASSVRAFMSCVRKRLGLAPERTPPSYDPFS